MSMAYVPVTLEGSVVSGESEETQGHPQCVQDFLCDLEQLLNFSGLRFPHWDDLKGLPRFLPLWEFQAGKQSLGIEDAAARRRGVCRLLISSGVRPTSCAEAKAGMNQDRERGGPLGD